VQEEVSVLQRGLEQRDARLKDQSALANAKLQQMLAGQGQAERRKAEAEVSVRTRMSYKYITSLSYLISNRSLITSFWCILLICMKARRIATNAGLARAGGAPQGRG
jgi:hypothetical protein